MKTKQKLNIGGELDPGDVVGIAYNNCIIFGWYVEEGSNGSLKFIPINRPQNVETSYIEFTAGTRNDAWTQKRFSKGLTFKNMYKDYIISFSAYNNRAFKIDDPEKFFVGSEQEKEYKESKRVLTDLKFPAR